MSAPPRKTIVTTTAAPMKGVLHVSRVDQHRRTERPMLKTTLMKKKTRVPTAAAQTVNIAGHLLRMSATVPFQVGGLWMHTQPLVSLKMTLPLAEGGT